MSWHWVKVTPNPPETSYQNPHALILSQIKPLPIQNLLPSPTCLNLSQIDPSFNQNPIPSPISLDPEPNWLLTHPKPQLKPNTPWLWAKLTPYPPKSHPKPQMAHALTLSQIDLSPSQNPFPSTTHQISPSHTENLILSPTCLDLEPNWPLSTRNPYLSPTPEVPLPLHIHCMETEALVILLTASWFSWCIQVSSLLFIKKIIKKDRK